MQGERSEMRTSCEQMFTILNFWGTNSLLLLTKGRFFGIIKVPRVYMFFLQKKSQEYIINCAQHIFSEIKHISATIAVIYGVGQNVPGVGQNVPPSLDKMSQGVGQNVPPYYIQSIYRVYTEFLQRLYKGVMFF